MSALGSFEVHETANGVKHRAIHRVLRSRRRPRNEFTAFLVRDDLIDRRIHQRFLRVCHRRAGGGLPVQFERPSSKTLPPRRYPRARARRRELRQRIARLIIIQFARLRHPLGPHRPSRPVLAQLPAPRALRRRRPVRAVPKRPSPLRARVLPPLVRRRSRRRLLSKKPHLAPSASSSPPRARPRAISGPPRDESPLNPR